MQKSETKWEIARHQGHPAPRNSQQSPHAKDPSVLLQQHRQGRALNTTHGRSTPTAFHQHPSRFFHKNEVAARCLRGVAPSEDGNNSTEPTRHKTHSSCEGAVSTTFTTSVSRPSHLPPLCPSFYLRGAREAKANRGERRKNTKQPLPWRVSGGPEDGTTLVYFDCGGLSHCPSQQRKLIFTPKEQHPAYKPHP